MHCSNYSKSKGKYIIKYENQKVEIFLDNKKIDIKKYESMYFDAYIPISMKRKIFNDSILCVIDYSDSLSDNITIAYKQFPNCNGQDVIDAKEEELKSKYIISINENIQINNGEGSHYLHEMQVEVNGKHYMQRCFYKCKSDSGVIMSCLTSSINSYKSKIEIFDLITEFIFYDKYNVSY
jgi:hypothetical protein